jgi:hypothetical protein
MAASPLLVVTLSIIIIVIAVIIGMYLGDFSRKFFVDEEYSKIKAENPLVQILSKKHKIVILIIPFCVALTFLTLYNWFSRQKFSDFLLYGFASAISNLIIMFIMLYIHKEEFVKISGNDLIAIVYVLTLIIPFFSYFVFISLVFSGCQVPFKF